MDIANTFAAIKNYNKMNGEAFNVGLSTANLTKENLLRKLKFIYRIHIFIQLILEMILIKEII